MEKIDSKENFIKLIQQYQNLVFSICLKLTGDYFAAEDLTQETFLSAYQHLTNFDGQAEKAWLCRIASNKCIDYLRAAARRTVPVAEEDMPEIVATAQEEPLSRVLNQELLAKLKADCESLKFPYREAALSHFVEGKTAAEIAAESKESLSTVKTRIYRAREMLKKSFFSAKKIVYDKAAIFLLILMTFFAMGMAVADECFRWAELQMWRYY